MPSRTRTDFAGSRNRTRGRTWVEPVLVAATITVGACGQAAVTPSPVPRDEAAPSGKPDAAQTDPFVYASVSTSQGSAPPRYNASLPRGARSSKAWTAAHPPVRVVGHRACYGHAPTRDALAQAVASAAEGGADAKELYAGYDQATGEFCERPGHCMWLGERVEQSSGAAKAFWAEKHSSCERFVYGPEPKTKSVAKFVSEALAPATVRRAVAAPRRRAEIVAAAATCVENVDPKEPWHVEVCLRVVAALDRERAVALANDLTVEDGSVAALATVLRAHPSAGSLEAKLDEVGLTAIVAGSANDPTRVLLTEILIDRGRALHFDAETGSVRNDHHHLLAELAPLVGTDTDGVTFDQDAPALDEDFDKIDPDETYLLHAFADGKRYTVEAADLGDWYDLPAVVGLLNAVMRERGKEGRFVTLPTKGQDVIVLGGSASALVAAAAAELIAPEVDLSASVESGKAFEDKVRKGLEAGLVDQYGRTIKPASGASAADHVIVVE